MSLVSYLRYEVLRTFRNRRFFIFSLGFPLILYFFVAGPSTGVKNLSGSGISAPLYFMVGIAAFGAMTAMLSTGARIADERGRGWNRQLRLTPLKPSRYLSTKLAMGYLMALVTLVLLFASGAILGVSMPATRWLRMLGLMLVGLLPFAGLGILLGHLLTADSIGPVVGGGSALLAFLGGTWFPLGHSGFLYDIARALPSYWLVQASHIAVGGSAWGALGWGVVAGWSAVLTGLAARAYRRDTKRV
ncbi:MAG: type transport system permease protein [Solirubrobacteraceae bacterium]|jgi:ABC-2 type transport system permease protein|nr:type transport system permease protein [Solirubrobacteraceae bacterium]